MRNLFKKLLFYLSFCAYSFILYCAIYYSIYLIKPVWLDEYLQITSEYVTAVILIFTAIFILAYVGASYLVYKRSRLKGAFKPVQNAKENNDSSNESSQS